MESISTKINPARQFVLEQMGSGIKEKEIMAEGIKSCYLEAGEGSVPVLLLHGAMANSLNWYEVMPQLARRFRVIAPDVVGYGESDKPNVNYDRAYYAGWLAGFTKALDLAKVSLVGNSLGGAIAAEFALQHPEQVERLILVNSMSLGKLSAMAAPSYTWGVVKAQMSPQKIKPEQLEKIWQGIVYDSARFNQITKAIGDYSLEVLARPNGTRPFWHGQTQAVKPFSKNQLASIKVPTLLLWGEADKIAPLKYAQEVQQFIPGAKLEIMEKAGHAPFFDRPDEFCQKVETFLS